MILKTNNKITYLVFAIIFIASAALFFASYRESVSTPSAAEISNPAIDAVKQSDIVSEKKLVLPSDKSFSGNQVAPAVENKSAQNQNQIAQEQNAGLLKVTLAAVRPIQSIQGRQSSSQAGDNGSTHSTSSGQAWLTTGKYDISIEKGATVYDTMTKLASSTCSDLSRALSKEPCRTAQFSFSAKYYSGLGYFIDAINGIKNANGNYWTLYVNGTYATVGASAYRLSGNDRIEWKYTDKTN